MLLTLRNNQGFTLIELIIAMSLISMIMVLQLGAMKMGNKSWESATAYADETSKIRRVQNFIRKQLEFVQPNRSELINKEQILVFKGDADQLHFTAPAPARHLGGGLYGFTFSLIDGENAKNLQLVLKQEHPDLVEKDNDAIDPLILIKDIEAIKFTYYGSQAIGEEFTWQDQWQETTRLPKLVKVEFKFDDKKIPWPDLLAPIYAEPQSQNLMNHNQLRPGR